MSLAAFSLKYLDLTLEPCSNGFMKNKDNSLTELHATHAHIAFVSGAIFALTAVLLGAFGAHGLKKVLTDYQLATWKTATEYQFWHALALIQTGMMCSYFTETRFLKRSVIFFNVGIALFSGSLYLICLKDVMFSGLGKWIVVITPMGGIAFLCGWASLLYGFLRQKTPTIPLK